jgi:MFS family permease
MSHAPSQPTSKITVTEQEASRIAFAAFVGTALEWYDYFLYGTAAALVFDRLFFVTDNALVSTMAAFASFAVGFLARPLGAVVFGHLGDRIGRRTTLIVTVTGIGVCTGVIGLLPTYLSVGVAAPVLLTLLRLGQGVAVGGEWGGAVTLAVEHAPVHHRGRFAALPQIGSPIGTLLSSGAILLVSVLPQSSFDAWGWRIPFLAAFPLLYVAIYLRRRVEESPLFEQLLREDKLASSPVKDVIKRAPWQLIVGAGTSFLGIGGFYLATTFMISYATNQLGVDKTVMLVATLVAAVIEIGVLIAGGRMAERFGAGPVTVLGGLLTAAVAFPVFWMVGTTNTAVVILAVALVIACLSVPYAVSGALLTALFPAALRYSGVSMAAQLAGVAAGFVPLVATAAFAASGQQAWAPALLLVGIAFITTVSGWLAPRLSISAEEEAVSAAA